MSHPAGFRPESIQRLYSSFACAQDKLARNSVRALFTLTIFVNSALLFVVEPMIAKYLLPNFGGSPLVWNVSMLFFQAMLLLGYLYAHLATRKLSTPVLLTLHLTLLALGVTEGWMALHGHFVIGGPPLVRLLSTLASSVGLVFLGLAAGSSLIQRLYYKTGDPHSRDPYFLYAASNLGSLLALLAYPSLLEPNLTLSEQARIFSIGVGILLVLLAICASFASRSGSGEEYEGVLDQGAPVSNRQRLKWVALTAGPSALLLGVTVYLTTDISPIPLLWVIPLSLYLLTFAIVFARHQLLPPIAVRILWPIGVLAVVLPYGFDLYAPTITLVPAHLLGFFILALACHQQVALSRPSPHHLTEYYLWLGIGGVVGGLFCAIVAPLVFTGLYEYPIAIAACCLFVALSLVLRSRRERPLASKLVGWAFDVIIAVTVSVVVGLLRAAYHTSAPLRIFNFSTHIPLYMVWMCFAGIGVLLTCWRPRGLALTATGLLIAIIASNNVLYEPVLFASRSFYGTRRVTQSGTFHRLINGTTLHGVEEMTEEKDKPLSYYSVESAIGRLLTKFGKTPRFQKVAFVGLGAGTLAAYGRPGQEAHFFELDPAVQRIATDPNLFTFVTDSKAKVSITLGDARLSLEQPGERGYGLLALDAFTSDAIPVHLLTREAIDDYLRALRPDGILAVHISNSYLDLTPVVAAAAREHGLVAYRGEYDASDEEEMEGIMTSEWIVLAHSKADLEPEIDDTDFWDPVKPEPGFRPWTDEYSNLLTVMNFMRRKH